MVRPLDSLVIRAYAVGAIVVESQRTRLDDGRDPVWAAGDLTMCGVRVRGFRFAGFSAPGYTQVPDEFFDVCLSHLSGAETKVMCYLLRRTFGWKKDSDAVSLSQITDGITRRDGSVLDSGAGVSRETATNALRGLEAKGLIVRERTTRPDGGTGTSVYRIHFRGSENPTPPVGSPDPGESGQRSRGVGFSALAPVGDSDPQDTGVARENSHQITDTWGKAREQLAGQFSKANYATYIAPLTLDRMIGNRAVLRAPSAFLGDWAQNRFGTAIGAALSEAAGRPIAVEVRG